MKTIKPQSLSNFFFLALLAVLPFNARHILNFETVQNIEGFREHISLSLYVFDFLLVAFLATSFWSFFSNRKEKKPGLPKLDIQKLKEKFKNPVLWLFIFMAISIALSAYPGVSLYNGLRLSGVFIFFIIASKFTLKNKKVRRASLLVIFLSGIIQSLLAIVQFSLQKSLGLWFLGESVISPLILGVSKFEFAGMKFVRSYGTFPHPNLLAAFLLLALACGFWFLFQTRKPQKLISGGIAASGIAVIISGILLSYSRSAIAAMTIFLLLMAIGNRNWLISKYLEFCKKIFINKIFQGALAIIFFFALLVGIYNLLLPRMCLKNCPQDNSISMRLVYNKEALTTIRENPFFGIGPGAFVEYSKDHPLFNLQPWEFQPVHNLFLVVSSEIGLLGLASFLMVIAWETRNKKRWKAFYKNPLALVFVLFLGLGMVDHYFWTIPQGQYIFWLSLAFLSRSR